MPAPAELLAWDSAFWGFPVARVQGFMLDPARAEAIDAWCYQNGVRCLYFLATADDPPTTRLAEEHGYHFADVRLTFGCRVPAAAENSSIDRPGQPTIRDHRPPDLEALQRIAQESYRDTRFYYDPHFERERCDALYRTWIKRSCQGWAQAVLVAEGEESPGGFITCHLDPAAPAPTGSIGLVGVDARTRGRGLGQTLVRAALAWFAARGAARVEVVTQGRNLAAQRLYQRSGFLTEHVQLWYHKWFPHGEASHG